MSQGLAAQPHHLVPHLLPICLRPHRYERTGSYLIRLAQANHCPPWSFLRLLGRIPSGQRTDLTPMASVTMNHAALTRLGAYLGKPTDHLARALPWITSEERFNDPTVLIRQPGRTFLRSCDRCEKRCGGARLMPNPQPMQLACQRHGTWLVVGEHVELDTTPEVGTALKALRRVQRRHGHDVAHAHYQWIHRYLTDEWRGHGWHRFLTRRWTYRQLQMHPTAHPNDIFVQAHTHHWSMLPETVALIQILARTPPHSSDLPTVNDISDALDLAEYWTRHPDERLALWITLHRASNMTDR